MLFEKLAVCFSNVNQYRLGSNGCHTFIVYRKGIFYRKSCNTAVIHFRLNRKSLTEFTKRNFQIFTSAENDNAALLGEFIQLLIFSYCTGPK